MRKLADPTAMVVATVDERGQPYQRIVLLKHYDEKGLVFYTNLGSRKAHQIENNPQVSLLFPWHMLERQVMVIGQSGASVDAGSGQIFPQSSARQPDWRLGLEAVEPDLSPRHPRKQIPRAEAEVPAG